MRVYKCEVTSSSVHGYGLRATEKIQPGERIVSELPFARVGDLRDAEPVCYQCLQHIPSEALRFHSFSFCSDNCLDDYHSDFGDEFVQLEVELTSYLLKGRQPPVPEHKVTYLLLGLRVVRRLLQDRHEDGYDAELAGPFTGRDLYSALLSLQGALRLKEFEGGELQNIIEDADRALRERGCVAFSDYVARLRLPRNDSFEIHPDRLAVVDDLGLWLTRDGRTFQSPEVSVERVTAWMTAILSRIQMNGFMVEDGLLDDSTGMGLFLLSSCANHQCVPNCMTVYEPGSPKQNIVALAPILPGEECFICYLDLIQSSWERHRDLQLSYGFSCHCTHCTEDGRLSPLQLQGTLKRLDLLLSSPGLKNHIHQLSRPELGPLEREDKGARSGVGNRPKAAAGYFSCPDLCLLGNSELSSLVVDVSDLPYFQALAARRPNGAGDEGGDPVGAAGEFPRLPLPIDVAKSVEATVTRNRALATASPALLAQALRELTGSLHPLHRMVYGLRTRLFTELVLAGRFAEAADAGEWILVQHAFIYTPFLKWHPEAIMFLNRYQWVLGEAGLYPKRREFIRTKIVRPGLQIIAGSHRADHLLLGPPLKY